MRKRTLVLCAAVLASVVVPIADALRIAPLRNRNGVVLTWRPQNKVAVVAQPNGRILAIHSLRRVTPGTRVTVQGIKWGTPVAGIKWGIPGQGIKWGIKWGRNGSYQSPLRPVTKRAVWTPVRGPIVKRFGRKAVAIGTRGGIVVVRIATRRGSEGLAGQHSLNAVTVPPVGATVSMRVYFGKRGIKIGRRVQYLKPPVPGAALPVAGVIASIDAAKKTMVLLDDQDPAYRVRFTVALPPEFTIAPYTVGQSVAAEGQLGARGVIQATLIALNGTFKQADNPADVQILTTGSPACANALQACPANPSPGDSGGALPNDGAVPSSSGSTPPPPAPPSGGVPPPPPPPPDPGLPPPGCRPANTPTGRAHWPRCLAEWCRQQKRLTGKRPPICRRRGDEHEAMSRPVRSRSSTAGS